MDEAEHSSQEAITRLLKSNLLIVGILCVGILLVIIGLVQIFSNSSPEITFESGPTQDVKASTTQKIMVDVEGAVINPGVYTLSANARVHDALIAAGGAAGDADHTYIARTLNLAQKITDGSKLYIPRLGELATSTPVGLSLSSNTSKSSTVNINSATMEELDTLAGVGTVTAQKIIDNRPYKNITELVSKKVIGQTVFDKIKDSISL